MEVAVATPTTNPFVIRQQHDDDLWAEPELLPNGSERKPEREGKLLTREWDVLSQRGSVFDRLENFFGVIELHGRLLFQLPFKTSLLSSNYSYLSLSQPSQHCERFIFMQ